MDRKPKIEPMDHSGAAVSSQTASPSNSPLPSTSSYRDFILRASAPSSTTGTKYNVMKFAVTGGGDRVIDPQDESQFLRPVKLNRKDPRTVRRLTDEDRERHNQRAIERAAKARGVKMEVDGEGGVKAEEGAEGAGADGADGAAAGGGGAKDAKEELDLSLVGKGAGGATNVQRRGPGGMFKKKTRRVFVSSEEARRLKREEWQPWVLEDDEGRERWIGRLEGGAGEIENSANKTSQQGQGSNNRAGLQGWRPAAESSATGGGGSAYVAFVLSDNQDEFRVLPVNRWYRFNQGPKYLTLAEEEAEEEVRPSVSLLSLFGARAHNASIAHTVRPPAKVQGPRALGHAPPHRASPCRRRRSRLVRLLRRLDPAQRRLVLLGLGRPLRRVAALAHARQLGAGDAPRRSGQRGRAAAGQGGH